MESHSFKTNISSPLGIQSIWDSLKPLGVECFNIDFTTPDRVLQLMAEHLVSPEKVAEAIRCLGYQCEELFSSSQTTLSH
jgi:hypothetical protein